MEEKNTGLKLKGIRERMQQNTLKWTTIMSHCQFYFGKFSFFERFIDTIVSECILVRIYRDIEL